MRLLLVKLSSLGDVVHALPAVTDAARAHPGLEVHWVVEERFRAIPALHPAVTKIVPVAIRRWREQWAGAGREILDSVRNIRAESYDVVLDSQGLIKSAVVACVARGDRVGFNAGSARERVASWTYRRGVAVARRQHAIDRQRALFAGALGYPIPVAAIDYGVRAERGDASGLLLAHGTTWTSKHWPEPFWAELARRALRGGERVTLPWGSKEEEARARRIAALAPGAEVARRLDLRGMIDLLVHSAAVVSADSGIGHLAAALGVRTLALYGPTDASLTGCRGASVTNLSAQFVCAPCLKRQCGYRGPPVFADTMRVEPACFATINPERVWQTLCGPAVRT